MNGFELFGRVVLIILGVLSLLFSIGGFIDVMVDERHRRNPYHWVGAVAFIALAIGLVWLSAWGWR